MCGIAGYLHPDPRPSPRAWLERMAARLAHRGPDGEGFHQEPHLGLAHRRLSIIDLEGGHQPMTSVDGDRVVSFNGEIFNYLELRQTLIERGHRFQTQSDTEVLLAGHAEWGRDLLLHLNGQFAFALWDRPRRTLLLARDRLGIRPLFWTEAPGGVLVFASEMKALFDYPGVQAALDPEGLGQILSLWVNIPPRTPFLGIQELEPGAYLEFGPAGRRQARYWHLSFPDAGQHEERPLGAWAQDLRDTLGDAVRLQLRADVPVATYLSGGLDSAVIASLAAPQVSGRLTSFSVGFDDPHFDERAHQAVMVDRLRTDHHSIVVDAARIGAGFSEVVRWAERPLLRTAPVPLLDLAGLVRAQGIKVVLTGEGADELFAGYSIFREDKVRRFWARQPTSRARPLLLSTLHPEAQRGRSSLAMWTAFFKRGLTETGHRYYSHRLRFENTWLLRTLLRSAWQERLGTLEQHLASLDAYIHPDFLRWEPLSRAQYLESVLFLPGYLLSSQGDRLMMGRSIEGRFPFLDHRVVELAARIPPKLKLRGLREKHILKEAFQDLVPASILERDKQPYRASITRCFLPDQPHEAALELRPESILARGYFEPDAVAGLLDKAGRAPGGRLSDRDDMALAVIASVQLLDRHFLGAGGGHGN
ncbi:MAG: asparagine synthase (glutamine-hydrolyzing) [Myxococcota bacterium]